MRRLPVCLLLVVHLVVAWAVGCVIADRRQAETVARAKNVLKRISLLSSDERYYEHLCRSLGKHLVGGNPLSAPLRPENLRMLQRLKVPNGRIWLFDGHGKLVAGVASDPAVLERMYDTLRKPWFARFNLNNADFPGLAAMVDDAGWQNLIDRRGQFSRANSRRGAGWGYWTRQEGVASGSIGGMLVFIDKKPARNDTVLGWVAGDLRRAGTPVGWFNRMKPDLSRLPAGLEAGDVKRFEHEFFSRGEDVIRAGRTDIAMGSYREQMLLVRPVSVVEPRIPPASWIVLMLWMLPCIRWTLFGRTRAPALSALLLTAVAVAGALPFCLSLLFWRHFAESRTQAVTASLRQELEQRLVRIDRKFPALIERLATRYRRWRARLETELARGDIRPTVPVPAQDGIEMRRFATDTPAFGLMEETIGWEERGTVDTIFLVDRGGLFWRESCDSMILFRRMAQWPEARRMKTLESLYRRQGDRGLNEFHWLFRMPREGYDRSRLYGENIFSQGTASRLASQLIRSSIGQYNIWMGIDSGAGGREDMTTLVTSGMMDSTFGDDLVSTMLRNIGNFTISSNEVGAAALYMDVVRNASGAAIAGFGGYHFMSSVVAGFFDEIMAAWQDHPDGMKLYAVSDQPCTLAYPGPDDDRRFSNLFRRLEPPDVLLSDVVRFEGRPAIMAALNCRQAMSYYLVGILPWRLVQERVDAMYGRLLAVAAGMSLILIVLCLRVWQGIVRPVTVLMRGVDAMEARSLDHRISISTGDELQRLAETFNETLAGMEELEVAKIVQQKLLPAGEVASGAWTYRGVSVMSSEVGGDYHDARLCPDGSIAFMLGDVSGHGVSAALVVAMAKAAFGNLARSGRTDPGELLEQMNAVLLTTIRKLKMMTAVAGLLKPDGTLLLANAGHCYPAVFRRGGRVEFVKGEGSFPLGVRQRGKWRAGGIALAPGDRLVLYTDGIPEAVALNGRQLDYERWLLMMADEAAEPDAMRLISRLHERLREYTHPAKWGDDVTIAVITRREHDDEEKRR